MLESLLQYQNIGWLVLRVALAAIFLYHGVPKLKEAHVKAAGMGWRVWQIVLLGLVETLGALGILFGVFLQVSALGLCVVMLGAIWMKVSKWHVPFSAMDKMGWEFDLILFAASLILLLGGGGSFVF